MFSAVRSLVIPGVVLVGSGFIGIPPLPAPPAGNYVHAVQLTSGGETLGLVMGASGDPIPGPQFVQDANNLYIDNPLHPNFPDTTYPGNLANGVFTPEGLYGLDGVRQLEFNYPLNGEGSALFAGGTSQLQGVTSLNDWIQTNLAAGDASTVFGYSQSTVLESVEMQKLDPSGTPSELPVQFVMIGDAANPNGGILERLPGMTLPSLGLYANGPAPADDFQTDVYTREYDGIADSPRYPLDILSDINADLGYEDVHSNYMPNPFAVASQPEPSQSDIANALLLPGSENLGTPDSLTNYYMIPTDYLPLLIPLRAIPVIGNPLADLLQPDLTVLVNLGYGDPDYGWSTTPANIPTPIGVLPSLSDLEKVPELLVKGTEQGVQDLEKDLSQPASAISSTTDASTVHTSEPEINPGDLLNLSNPSNLINDLSGAASVIYATILPTLDLLNAAVVSVPAYDAHLFVENLSDPIKAIGLVLGADTELSTLGPLIELTAFTNAIAEAMSYFVTAPLE